MSLPDSCRIDQSSCHQPQDAVISLAEEATVGAVALIAGRFGLDFG